MHRTYMCLLAALFVLSIAPARADTPVTRSDLNPFPGIDLKALRQAAIALKGPNGADLQAAASFYSEFKGSWMPGARKPDPARVQAFDALKARLEKPAYPAWFLRILNAGGEQSIGLITDPKDPHFVDQKEDAETERLKALGMVYLTEHELDRAGAAEKGAQIISVLIVKTPLDSALHSFYARFLLDAQQDAMAWQEACSGLYLNPRPDQSDMSFVAFVGRKAAPDRWESIKQMFKETAADPRDADAVIKEWEPRFGQALEFKNMKQGGK